MPLPPPSNNSLLPGLTPKSLAASLLGLVVIGWTVVTAVGTLGYGLHFGSEPLAAPAMISLLLLVAWVALARLAVPSWAFTRQEMITVAYILLVAAPIAGKSFWLPALSMVAPHASRDQWQTYGTLPEQLRPFGPNLLESSLQSPERWESEGADLQVQQVAFARGTRSGPSLSLRPTGEFEEPAKASLTLKLVEDGLRHNSYYLFTALFRVEGGGPTAEWTATLRPDSPEAPPVELVRGRGQTDPSYVHPEGFERRGNYAFQLPSALEEEATIEIAFAGQGQLEVADIELRDMTAFALTKTGAPSITSSEYQALPEAYKAGVLVRPDNLWSLAGLKYLVVGTVMWEPWLKPFAWWLAFLALLLGGAFAIALIMRRQWIDSERYPMPLTMPIADLVGRPEEKDIESRRRMPAVFRNGFFWGGVTLALGFCLFDIAAGYSDAATAPTSAVPIKPYLSGSQWGDTWTEVNFRILPLAVGIGLLMELNVLGSLVIGFFLYRLQFWLGHQTGWDADGDYPYPKSQGLGAFVFYGLAVLFLARNYIKKTLGMAFRSERPDSEPFTYSGSYATLAISGVGLFLWSRLLGSSVSGSIWLSALGLLAALVYMKLRAECGVPGITWFNQRMLLFVPVVGGLTVIGPSAFGLNAELGRMLSAASILIVAGLQLEFLEMARRYRIKRWHIPAALGIAIVGGVFVGAWFMLGGAYATGTENWMHSTMVDPAHTNVRETQRIISQATAEMNPDIPASGIGPRDIAFYSAGAVTIALAGLRLLFAGFWFHPIGFLLGPSDTIANAWGSLLLAWGARMLVLRLGGAATVREKLRPAAVGLIAGTVMGFAAAIAVNSIAWSLSPGSKLPQLLFSTH